ITQLEYPNFFYYGDFQMVINSWECQLRRHDEPLVQEFLLENSVAETDLKKVSGGRYHLFGNARQGRL
ncbi:MAG: hypothetical protein L7U83_08070, partial [Akkermansiaceae bacterium]|nr:hypothetical protein [Akkermansiaceae bacterium]